MKKKASNTGALPFIAAAVAVVALAAIAFFFLGAQPSQSSSHAQAGGDAGQSAPAASAATAGANAPASADVSQSAPKPDSKGCMPSEGYTWCEDKQKCLRVWEESCPTLKAIDAAIAEGALNVSRQQAGNISMADNASIIAASNSTMPANNATGAANNSAPLIGGDRDSHGCIASAGYAWCEALQACIQPWETNCTAPLIGGDKDVHGCYTAAGYSWCGAKQKCIRSWEENCAASNGTAPAVPQNGSQ